MNLPLPATKGCYFCDIIESRADRCNVIAESDLTLTVLNGRQFEVGQCMVVTKRHAPTMLDLDDVEAAAVMREARRLAQALCDGFGPDGILIYQNRALAPLRHVQMCPTAVRSRMRRDVVHADHVDALPAQVQRRANRREVALIVVRDQAAQERFPRMAHQAA